MKKKGGPGSPSSTTPTPKPQIQGKIVQVTGNEPENDDDIKVLEKLEKAASTKKSKPKAAARKRKSLKPKGAAKKKAKDSKD